MESIFLQEVLDALIEGDSKKALELMIENRKYSGDHEKDIRFQLGRSNRLQKDIDSGIIPFEHVKIERNKIALATENIFLKLKDNFRPSILPLIADPVKLQVSKVEVLEKLIGGSQLQQISWLMKGVNCSMSVCRIATKNNIPKGTGFLLEDGTIITNNHVIDEFTDVSELVAQFNYEFDEYGKQKEFYSYSLNKAGYFKTSKNLDYTKVMLEPSEDLPPLSRWKYLNLIDRIPLAGDHVTIIQHPLGNQKQIALNENEVVFVKSETLEYTTDTEAGSSGSPVFNDDWQVIGLHRAASSENDTNIATHMGLILEHIEA